LKTKRRNESAPTINLVGFDPVLCERIRASLGRSPFHFTSTDEPLPDDEVDLFVVAAAHAGGRAHHGVPVIACGSAGLLRSAFLAGCADYLREPWTFEELGLRARAALSRQGTRWEFPWGEVRIEGARLHTAAGSIVLTYHQAVILRALLRERGRPVPRAALACLLGGQAGQSRGSRSIDMHISALRRRLRDAVPEAGRFIVCVRAQGYMIP
jgi:DNA-binding response OmpR family regulator